MPTLSASVIDPERATPARPLVYLACAYTVTATIAVSTAIADGTPPRAQLDPVSLPAQNLFVMQDSAPISATTDPDPMTDLPDQPDISSEPDVIAFTASISEDDLDWVMARARTRSVI